MLSPLFVHTKSDGFKKKYCLYIEAVSVRYTQGDFW